MRRTLGLLLVTALLLPGGVLGEHLSVGASETVHRADLERPHDPSVDASVRERGRSTDCQDPDPRREGTADALCGLLVYHEGTPFEERSPRDQALEAEIGTFDVQATHYAGGLGLRTCLPWCATPPTMNLYEGMQEIVSPYTGSEGDDGGQQRYGPELRVEHASGATQRETGTWSGNGWLVPAAHTSFVGYLYDDQGHAITPEDLQALVDDPSYPHAMPAMCGFTPDADLDPRGSRPGCEVPFAWRAQDASGPCSSPTYTCGSVRSAWHAQIACTPAAGTCGARTADNPLEGSVLPREPANLTPSADRPADSTTEPAVWHFVVGPTPSACQGDEEPGFDLDPRGLGPLAHDLDIYTVPDDNFVDTQATPTADWGARRLAQDGSQAWREATDPAFAAPEQEPTTEATVHGLGDDTGTVRVDREWRDCRALWSPAETPDTLDPWVNRIDARLERSHTADHHEHHLEPSPPTQGPGRTGLYTPTGEVGLFADRDDDGRPEQAPWADAFDRPARTGTYPVLWDMRADRHGNPGDGEGCRVTPDGPRLPAAMAEAGYGPRTGLIQAVATEDPTTWVHRPTETVLTAPQGGVFVLASQAIVTQGMREHDTEPLVEERIDTLSQAARELVDLEEADRWLLNPYLQASTDGDAARSDLQPQCGEPTGGFTSTWSLTRTCRSGCGSAASVTEALLDLGPPSEAFLDGQAWARPMPVGHEEVFAHGVRHWTDVDRWS